eukprot:Phypoly_transcript_08583.p1 GENE.Phypoly_transcript_08583~~Phypoly_transcript_08583.p1  ORF type:complete len:426 (+),score=66.69 Phypoly_transcript_08583:133-1410(+)
MGEQMENVSLSVDPQVNCTTQGAPTSTTEGKPDQDPSESPSSLLARKLVGVLAIATALAIFLWFMAGAGFPWFIYIVYGVFVINSIIYAVKTKNSFFANLAIYASTNVMLFITFLACGGGYPWFMMPVCSLAIIPVSQYIWRHYEKGLRFLYIHASIYVLINSMIFFIWVIDSISNPYPWFIYPWCGWLVPLLIQYNVVVMHDRSRLFVFICADLGVMLMITFRFAIGPLFMVFVLIALVAVVLYYLLLKKGYAAHCWCLKRNQPDATAPSAPAQATAQAPFNFSLPQFHVQVQPNYQQVAPPPPGALYFSAGQTPTYQQDPSGRPFYYYPGPNGQLYPVFAPIPQDAAAPAVPVAPGAYPSLYPPTVPYPTTIPSPAPAPAQSDAVLTSDAKKEKENKEEEEEDTQLLRNSPPQRNYTQPPPSN